MSLIWKAITVCLFLALAGVTGAARAADWTLVLRNTGTAEDLKEINTNLGNQVSPSVKFNCVPGDHYALYLKAGSRNLKVLVQDFVSLNHYVKPVGLKREVQFVKGKDWTVKAGTERRLQKKGDLVCSPLGLQQILVGGLRVDDGQRVRLLAFNLQLTPTPATSTAAWLKRQPLAKPGPDNADLALGVAMSHLAYYDNTAGFVTNKLRQAGFAQIRVNLAMLDGQLVNPARRLAPALPTAPQADPDSDLDSELESEPDTAAPDGVTAESGNDYFVAVRKDTKGIDVLYVAIRGTELDDVVDIISDIDCSMFNGYHRGFRDYALAIYKTLRNSYGSYLKRTNRFFLTGHSLGGATATVLSLLLHRNLGIPLERIDVVTFGAPRAVGTHLVPTFDDKSQNLALRHPTDPVPQSFTSCPPSPQYHYSHLGDLMRVEHHGQDTPILFVEIDEDVGGWSDFWKNTATGWFDHHDLMVYYNSIAARVKPEVPIVPTQPLNDTGIDWCADGTRNFLSCPVAGYPWQDAQDGRDATHNNDSDGHAGFSFTKISNSGKPLPNSAVLGSGANDWACTRDNVTGLIWEVKTDDGGLRDKDWTYSWYNPDTSTNGGFEGYPDYGDNCFNKVRCDTHKFVADANAKGLCGASDWRLPNRFELESLTRNDRYIPAIDTSFFPNTTTTFFWSSAPHAHYTNFAWSLEFEYAHSGYHYKYHALYLRLVRDGQ